MSVNLINDYLLKQPKIKEIINEINLNNKAEISEASREVASLISLCLKQKIKNNIVIVAPNIYEAQKIYDELSSSEENIYFRSK